MSTRRWLEPELLSREAFAPFGEVIAVDDGARHFTINGGTTERYHALAKLDLAADGHGIVSVFRGRARDLPFEVAMLERHPKGSQAFMPLNDRPYLVVVAPAGDRIEAASVRLFLARAGQGVNYARGVWHHPLLALDDRSDFLVIDYDGPGPNCDEIALAPSCWIAAPVL